MIKTPVSYSNKFSNITDSESCFVAHVVKENKADEIVKRINMHDELVDMIGKLLSEIDACDTYSVANQATIFMAEELLERCE